MNFLKTLLATILGFFISLFILVFLLVIATIGIITMAVKGVENNVVVVKPHSILKIDLKKSVPEHIGADWLENFRLKERVELRDYAQAILSAASDENIEGITLVSDGFPEGITKAKAIRDALKAFKEKGKFIYAYGDNFSQKDYYIKSVADSIFISPLGRLDFKGLASEVLYFKNFQKETGIEMTVIRHGKYKSAVEPFLLDKMSDENRYQITELLKSVWGNVAAEVSESRHINTSTLNLIAENLSSRTPEKAVGNKMIDGILYSDEFESLLKKRTGVNEADDLNTITLRDYASTLGKKQEPQEKIAIIYASGEITNDRGIDNISHESMQKAFSEAASSEDVKGIVLRINSPGGSALVSDLIWREVEKAKLKKPVYVSMGDVAASGGYYIACGANRIFAEKTTITGSIGVFGTLPKIKKLANRWGVNADHVTTHKNAQIYSPFEDMAPEAEAFIREDIEDIYNTFVKKVALGRNKPFSEIDNIAQGRVWTGEQALAIGLIDEIGGIDAAAGKLAETLGLQQYGIRTYPNPNFDEWFEEFLQASVAEKIFGKENYLQFKKYISIKNNYEGIQARLPFDVKID